MGFSNLLSTTQTLPTTNNPFSPFLKRKTYTTNNQQQTTNMVQINNVLSLCIASFAMSATVHADGDCSSDLSKDDPVFADVLKPALDGVFSDSDMERAMDADDVWSKKVKQCLHSFSSEEVQNSKSPMKIVKLSQRISMTW